MSTLHSVSTAVVLVASAGPLGCGGRIDAGPRDGGSVAAVGPSEGSASGTPDPSGGPPSTDAAFGSEVATLDESDAGTPVGGSWLDAALDASEVAPCLDAGTLMYVVGRNYGTVNGAINGVESVGLGQGTWTTRLISESAIQIDVGTSSLGWQLDIVNPTNGITTGTYSTPVQTPPSYLQIVVDGGGCSGLPAGSYTIAELVTPYGDQVPLSKFLVWFDLQCADAGTLQGCVTYGN